MAKLAVGEADSPDLSQSPTATAAGTRDGVILGTAAYMSPEQARGKPVDKRTDIWAFGCVLYEMLTGRQAFGRETVSDTIAAILDREPDWERLPPTLPSTIDRLLKKCLAKDVRRRLRSIGDASLELDEIVPEAVREAPSTVKKKSAPVWIAATLAGFLAIGAVIVAVWNISRTDPRSMTGVVRYSIDLPLQEQFEGALSGVPIVMAISPDGRQIVYSTRSSSGNRLYRRGRDEFESTPIQGTDGGFGPFFSPDGKWIGFVAAGTLRKVPVGGGTPQVICAAANVLGGSWSIDDTIVWGEWGGGLSKVAASGGTPEPLTKLDEQRDEVRHGPPRFTADARHVLFSVHHRDAPSAIEVVDVVTGRRQHLVQGDGAYLSRGRLVFARGSTVLATPFDSDRLALGGPEVRLLDGVANAGPSQSQFAVAADGTLVYMPAPSNSLRLVWVDRKGATSRAIDDERRFSHPRISPEGDRVLVQVESVSGGNEFWIYDVKRGLRTRLGTTGSRPIWEAHGTRVTFQRNADLYSMPADDSGESERLVAREEPASGLFPLAWSFDGEILIFSRPAPKTNRDIFTMRRGEAPRAFVATSRDERSAMLSPDGRWMVYGARDVGREEEIYVQPYPSREGRVVISAGGGLEPVWSPTGTEIFYRSSDGRRMLAVDVTTQPTFGAGTPRTLFEGRFLLGSSYWADYDVSRDGIRFLMLEASDQSNPRLNVVVNWLDSSGSPSATSESK